MAKRTKILFILIGVSLLLIIYLILTSRVVTIKTNDTKSNTEVQTNLNKVDLIALEKNYKKEVKIIFSDYEQELSQLKATTTAVLPPTLIEQTQNKLSQLKIRLLDLKVPTQFKDLHLNLILSLSKISSYLSDKDEQTKTAGISLAEQAKKDYAWLNN